MINLFPIIPSLSFVLLLDSSILRHFFIVFWYPELICLYVYSQ